MILHKIERAQELIIDDELNPAEIGGKLPLRRSKLLRKIQKNNSINSFNFKKIFKNKQFNLFEYFCTKF